MFLVHYLKTLFLTWSFFKDMSTVEYSQNLWCYMSVKREQNNWNEFSIFDEYIGYNFWFLCIDWPKLFPEIMYVYKKIVIGDENFHTGAPANQRNFHNKLRNFGKIMNNKKEITK